MGTTPATSCCARSPVGSAAAYAPATPSSALVATSSSSCWRASLDRHVHDLASRLLTALHTPVPLAEPVVTISGSVGVALDRGGLSAEQLLAAADLAMYEAKRAGRDRLHWHEPQPPGRRGAVTNPPRCNLVPPAVDVAESADLVV